MTPKKASNIIRISIPNKIILINDNILPAMSIP